MKKMMKMNKSLLFKVFTLLFSITLLLGNTSNAHKFYMSITDMEYNSKSKSLQISMKLFVDDIEQVLEKEQDVRMLLGTEKEHPNTDQFIKTYLKTHFFIEQSKGSIPITFIGKEVDKDYAWIYLEVKNFKVKDETLVTNSMLLDYFTEQTNKINYKKGEEVISFTLFKENVSKEF